jgi:hypothetical protein
MQERGIIDKHVAYFGGDGDFTLFVGEKSGQRILYGSALRDRDGFFSNKAYIYVRHEIILYKNKG